MERAALILLFTLLLNTISQISGKNQFEALSLIYGGKLMKNNTSIDIRHFNATGHHFGGVKIYPQEGLKEKDRIGILPGQPPVKFKQYGGYVTVNQTAGRAFYYYFAEAQRDDKSLPLLLWLNGGPGCSSLIGAMQELGPFRVHSDGKTLYQNKFAWNHAANVLFLESPAGVGFSYTNTSADLENNGDRNTAIDNYAFLLNWFERFPEYKNRDFYIAGESYAGHYVPQLAHTILVHNQKANKTIINLQGINIGNAVINDETDARGIFEYLATHAIISDEISDQIMKYCNFTPNATNQTDACIEAGTVAIRVLNDINIYNIYAALCHNTSTTDKPKKKASVLYFDPCSDYYDHAYMNRAEVQEALHANVTKLPYDWQQCSTVVLSNWRDSPVTVIPLLNELMANGLRVWIFSGDIDGRIPVTSTKLSIKQMKLPIVTPWHPWFLGGEVGGYTQVYKGNLTFVTVRGAGHQVPSYQPARGLSLIMHFLAGTELPNSVNSSRNSTEKRIIGESVREV